MIWETGWATPYIANPPSLLRGVRKEGFNRRTQGMILLGGYLTYRAVLCLAIY